MVESFIHTDGSTCPSIRCIQKYSLGWSNSWTLSLDRRFLPNKGIRVSGTSRNKLQKWRSPQEQAKGWAKYHSKGWPNMPQMLTLLLDLGSGGKGMTGNQAPLSKRKMTLCFSTVRTTQSSSVWMSRTGAWTGCTRTHHLWASSPNRDRDSVTSSDCPYGEGRVLKETRAVSCTAHSWTLSFEVSLLSTMVASPDIGRGTL
jgi:hypothetical protein